MAGPLKNARHERFAQELAKGKSQADAYAAAKYRPSEPNASRLTRNDKVKARVAELQGKAATKAATTAADIAAELDEARELAKELKQVAPMVAATMGKAKVLGLIFEQHKAQFDFGKLTDEESETLLTLLAKCQRF
jgi:hypothetical protein